MKIKELKVKYDAILKAAQTGIRGKEGYALAKNIKLMTPLIEDFNSDNDERIRKFAKLDENGEPIIFGGITKLNDKGVPVLEGGRYDFEDRGEEATKIWNDLLEKEVKFEPYMIERSEATDNLPVEVLVELIDFIIIDK